MSIQTKIFLGSAIVLVLGLGWYGLSPLLRNVEVNDALPENIVHEVQDEVSLENELVTADENVGVIFVPQAETKRFPVVGTKGHPASGSVQVIDTTDGTVLRYEDFETINGPNLHVYLAKDIDAKEFIDLGSIKGTQGNINYTLPEDVDLTEYRYVMYWCVPFSVLFNYAEIK